MNRLVYFRHACDRSANDRYVRACPLFVRASPEETWPCWRTGSLTTVACNHRLGSLISVWSPLGARERAAAMDPARARERRSSPVDRQYDLRNRSIHSGHSHGPQSQPRSLLRPTEPARMVATTTSTPAETSTHPPADAAATTTTIVRPQPPSHGASPAPLALHHSALIQRRRVSPSRDRQKAKSNTPRAQVRQPASLCASTSRADLVSEKCQPRPY